MVSKNKLILEIKKQFPRMNKPANYADLILEGKRLNATSKINALKRKKFLETNVISKSIFQSSSKLGLLDKFASSDKTIAVSSTRRPGNFAFDYSMILSYLNYERYLLYNQMIRDINTKKIICIVLKIPITTTKESIEKKMVVGTPHTQVDIYKKIYEKIKKDGISTICMWLGVVRLPAFRYCLSNLANSLLYNSK